MEKKNIFIGYSSAIAAGLTFGLVPIVSVFLRDNNVSSVEQVFIRLIIAFFLGVLLLMIIFTRNKPIVAITFSKKFQWVYFIQGILLTLMIIVYITAISLGTPVGEAALLVQVHPIITLIIGRLLLDEQITGKKIFALIIAFLGIIFITRPWEWTQFLSSFVGDLLAISNGIFYAFYLLVGRYASIDREKTKPIISISWVWIYSFIASLPLLLFMIILPLPAIVSAFSLDIYTSTQIILLSISLAFVGSVLPYGLIMVSAKTVESSKTSILLLGEPLSAIIFGALILGEPITIFYLIGGGALLVAIIIILESSRSPNMKKKEIHLGTKAEVTI